MENKEWKDSQEKDWFDSLLSPEENASEIGTDEHALSGHEMGDMADIELEKIIQEAKSSDWTLSEEDSAFLAGVIPQEEPAPQTPNAPALEDEYNFTPDQIDQALAAYDQEEDDHPPLEPEEKSEAEAAADGRVVRKVRPKKKNGYGLFGLPHLASVVIWAALCVAIGVSLGRWLWICAADVLAFGRVEREVSITVSATDNLDSVTDMLHDAGLIKYPSLFKLYCQLAKADVGGKISTGTFTLNTLYDYHALVGGMSSTSSYRETLEVMIPEGYTCAQIFALLEERGICTVAELEAYCTQSEFSSYWFLEDVQKGTKYCLEGFLFPDTYQFYTNSSAQQVFIKFLGRFEDVFDEEMLIQLDILNEKLAEMYRKNGLSQSYIDSHRITITELITVASLIEKETAYSGESQNIASVIYNRLTNPSEYPKLNIDATIVYALGGKTDLTPEDMAFDSPYNTYLYEGLPPGAIGNPGLYSIKAALNPTDTNYHFYALDTSGEGNVHRFFATYAEHLEFIQGQG